MIRNLILPALATLIPGITLVSGMLTYYPANHPEAAVTFIASFTYPGHNAESDTVAAVSRNHQRR